MSHVCMAHSGQSEGIYIVIIRDLAKILLTVPVNELHIKCIDVMPDKRKVFDEFYEI